jgi:hypothetical protein
MATYRLSVYVAKRSDGRSATAMAAYRACEAVTDLRTGEQHDYTRKAGLLSSQMILPENAPEWARDRAEMWNRSEASHRKGNAIVAREIQLSLPHELDAVQRREVTTQFAQQMADRYGVAVDTCLHSPNKEGDQRNFHAHLMLCTRPFDAEQETGLSKNTVREFDPIACQKAGGENHVTQWRETWSEMLNRALERANVRDSDGAAVEVDHRSYKAREMDLEPQLKEGPAATAKKRRGEETDRSQVNSEIKDRNAARMDAEELRRRQAQQITERGAREMGLKEKQEAPNPKQRQAKDMIAEQIAQEIAASNDNAPEKPRYLQQQGETELQFEKRVARLEAARARREENGVEEKLDLEMHHRPKGPVFGR